MSRAVVFGIAGDATLWIADLDAGTVKQLDAAAGELAKVADLRKAGATVVKKVDFAVAVSTAKAAFSGHVES
ncbi:hypothetical protein J2W42_000748 [Rhizobium tibeticum]|uniref:Uncharacterized protein n=1 Tax=Rhizobium tibeticum TaxID=501024 RepID=A0A1H8PDE3_9HYPH|nr:hypothetical protein [Rhizobium tibeticum]MDP9807910.1 hypothetical protein [Rhizobium tibeticum]SEI02967.1 hypothetical protein RTCCBAU85039_3835 [Rhizobium tibeticum]SEO39777.1 hypothetical protein SAMN05216228_1016128 [Rhizobium tibeticum]